MPCHADLGQNKTSVVNPIMWHSKKIQKVAVSTLSAEAMALAGAVDILSWVRLYWGWLMDTQLPWKHADKTLLQLPPAFAAIPLLQVMIQVITHHQIKSSLYSINYPSQTTGSSPLTVIKSAGQHHRAAKSLGPVSKPS